ncbi:DUF6968 family protein [Falsiroseomonas ponticola]|uniref:DUF6968 family protein n=1 Tax=Falsiroseomonas ponticola TaxID=2786951 RepID=UPI0019343BA2|nr:hypothetical protein [Roseomonas ponticola]
MEVIAERRYQLRGMADLVLCIGKPEPFPDGRDFLRPYEIDGPLTQRRFRLGGADAVQALLLAIAGASLDLGLCEEAVRGLLSLDGVIGDLGLPDPQALHGTRKGAG